MLVPCKYHLWGHCRNKTSCRFDHSMGNCHRGLHCPMKGDQCKLRHVETCRRFLSGSCGFLNKKGRWKEYPNCSYNHQVSLTPPVIQRWKKCDNLAEITKKNLDTIKRDSKGESEKIKILTINDSFKAEGKKGEQTSSRSKTNLLAIVLLTAVLMIRAELINDEKLQIAVGSSGKTNLLATVLLIVLSLAERAEQIKNFLAKMRINLGKALAGDVQGKIEKQITDLKNKVRVLKTLQDKMQKLEGKIAKLQKCRTETAHVASNDKLTKQRQRQLINSCKLRTKVCRNCKTTPCLRGKQVTSENLVCLLWKGKTKVTRTRVQGQFNGAPLKDEINQYYRQSDLWLFNQNVCIDLDKIKTLKYNCLD